MFGILVYGKEIDFKKFDSIMGKCGFYREYSGVQLHGNLYVNSTYNNPLNGIVMMKEVLQNSGFDLKQIQKMHVLRITEMEDVTEVIKN